MATGTVGVLAGAKELCPLKSTPERVAHTTFLALSLISFAVSQLVLVLAAGGLVRDLTKAQEEFEDPHYVSLCFLIAKFWPHKTIMIQLVLFLSFSFGSHCVTTAFPKIVGHTVYKQQIQFYTLQLDFKTTLRNVCLLLLDHHKCQQFIRISCTKQTLLT